MVKKLNKNAEGFTYAELIICLLIIAIVVGPICASFASANKIRATSQALNNSITHTEALMEAVKAQLTMDIKLKKQKENMQLYKYPSTDVENRIKLCLEKEYESTDIGKDTLERFLEHIPVSDIKTLYNTERYAYEIAIWRASNMDLSAGINTLEFKGDTLERAAKFYSDSMYEFSEFATSSANIKFEVSDGMKKAFQKEKIAYAPQTGYSVLDQHTLILTPDNLKFAKDFNDTSGLKTISLKGNQITINQPVLINGEGDKIDSLIYTATTSGGTVLNAINIIDVDVRQLLRKKNVAGNGFEPCADYDGLTLKFINDTDQDQIVRIIRSASEGIDSLETVDKKINVVAIDQKSGKTSIQRVEDVAECESFIIAIVVRDKTPVIGQPGKVVKKMIDVYSYEIGND